MFYHIKQSESEGSQADWSSSHRWAFCVAFYVALCSVLLQILPSGWRKGKWVHQSFFFFFGYAVFSLLRGLSPLIVAVSGAGAILCCNVQVSHCGDFSCTWALFAAEYGL